MKLVALTLALAYLAAGPQAAAQDLARATLCALTCPDPGHIPLLVVADDISSVNLTSRELLQKLLPDIEWRGGDEYEADPYKGLVDNSRAKEVLEWAAQFHWRSA